MTPSDESLEMTAIRRLDDMSETAEIRLKWLARLLAQKTAAKYEASIDDDLVRTDAVHTLRRVVTFDPQTEAAVADAAVAFYRLDATNR